MTFLSEALDYAARGWRVFPLKPGTKTPAVQAWQNAATCDPVQIRRWWERDGWGDHGIGIATGQESDIFVLDVDTNDGKVGAESFAKLEAGHGTIPVTREAITGTGGRHLYYAMPEGVILRNSAGKLGADLDVRGDGGYVVAPPTIHPDTGQAYEWELSSLDEPVEAPAWLVGLCVTSGAAVMRTDTVPYVGTERPGDRFAAAHSWPELLQADGATFLGEATAGGHRYEMWARPGVDHQSATLYYGGSDVLKVFTGNWPGLEADATYTRFGYWAATQFGGDYTAATRALGETERAAGFVEPDMFSGIRQPGASPTLDRLDAYGLDLALQGLATPPTLPPSVTGAVMLGDAPEPSPHGWEGSDVAAILAEGYDPIQPTVLQRSDGLFLFYAGRINVLLGESGGGKTWVAMYAAAQVMATGGGVLFVDLEDHIGSVLARMMNLGVKRATLAELFDYVTPQRSWTPEAAEDLARRIVENDVELVVIDSTGEAMAIDGAKPNDDDETARWFRRIPRYLARLGPAVILTDHVPKSKEVDPTQAIGSQRKKAAVDGASFRVDARVAPTKTAAGHLILITAKDRNGTWQARKPAAEVRIVDRTDAGGMVWTDITVDPPKTNDGRPTYYMELISRHVEAHEGLSRRALEQDVDGKAEHIRKALTLLVQENYVEARPRIGRGGGFDHFSLRPFRDDDGSGDMFTEYTETSQANGTASPASQPRPLLVDTASEVTETEPRPPRPPRIREGGDAGRGSDERTDLTNLANDRTASPTGRTLF